MKTSTTISITLISFIFIFSTNLFAQSNGDFRSKKSGKWGKKQTWEVYSNGNWSSSNNFPMNASNKQITISSGHAVEYDKSNVKIGHLSIELGGTLFIDDDKGSNGILKLYGNLQCNGVMSGNTDDDDEGFILALNGTSTIISGNGDCKLLKIFKATTASETDLIIDTNLELVAEDEAAIYNPKNNSFLNIIVNPGAFLQVDSFIDMRVGNGNSNKQATLHLKSDETGFGSLMVNEVDNSDESNTLIERYLSENTWHYICPPVENAPASVFYDIYLMQFSEVSGSWTYITDPEQVLSNEMQGYATWASSSLTGSAILEFEGSIKTGEFDMDLTRTANATHNNKGFNFVGNPYSAAIDWNYSGDDGWNKNHVDNAIYLWNGDFGGYGSYVGGIGVNNTTNIIPAHQGFIVHCNQDNGTLGLNSGVQVNNSDAFLKSENAIDDILRLSVAGGGFKDETVVRLWDDSSFDFDAGMDAIKLFSSNEAPQIYSINDAGDDLSINSLPIEDIQTVVKLGFKAENNGIYTLSFDEIKGVLASRTIILEDLISGEKIELNSGNSYSFSHNTLNAFHRFNLIFQSTSGWGEIFAKPIEIDANIYAYENRIYVEVSKFSLHEIKVANLMGQEVLSEQVNVKQSILEIDQEGYYIVSVVTDEGTKRSKVYIK